MGQGCYPSPKWLAATLNKPASDILPWRPVRESDPFLHLDRVLCKTTTPTGRNPIGTRTQVCTLRGCYASSTPQGLALSISISIVWQHRTQPDNRLSHRTRHSLECANTNLVIVAGVEPSVGRLKAYYANRCITRSWLLRKDSNLHIRD